MAQPSKLMIGTLAAGQAAMVTLDSLGIRTKSVDAAPAHNSRYVKLGNGALKGVGYRQAEWHLNGIRDTHWAALYAYRTSQTTELYIRTYSEDGKTFRSYICLMTWPETPPQRDHDTDVVLDFTLTFTHMVEQAELP